MTLHFRADEFEQFRAGLIAQLREGAATAARQAGAPARVALPRHLQGAQGQVDAVLAHAPDAIAQLQAMIETFDRKLAATAVDYQRVDEAAAERLRRMTGRQS